MVGAVVGCHCRRLPVLLRRVPGPAVSVIAAPIRTGAASFITTMRRGYLDRPVGIASYRRLRLTAHGRLVPDLLRVLPPVVLCRRWVHETCVWKWAAVLRSRLIMPIELGEEPIDETTTWDSSIQVLVQNCPIALVTVTSGGPKSSSPTTRRSGSSGVMLRPAPSLAASFSTEHAARAIGYLASLASAPAGTSTFFSGELGALPDERGPRSNQTPRWVHVYGRNLTGGDSVQSLILDFVDATQARQREQALARRALYDDLTGLPNRTLLTERLQSACDQRPGLGALDDGRPRRVQADQ